MLVIITEKSEVVVSDSGHPPSDVTLEASQLELWQGRIMNILIVLAIQMIIIRKDSCRYKVVVVYCYYPI